MIWAFLSRFNDILAFIGVVMLVKWSIEISLWISRKLDRANPVKEND